jgi:hypothetical protein
MAPELLQSNYRAPFSSLAPEEPQEAIRTARKKASGIGPRTPKDQRNGHSAKLFYFIIFLGE